MAVGDISAIPVILVTPGTNPAVVATVPNDEEWTVRMIRAVCLIASGGQAPSISVGLSAACNELCFNEVVPIPSGSVSGAKGIVGGDFGTLPPGTPIYARGSAANAVRLAILGTRKKVS